jgi:hypothetical protein
MTRIVRQLSIRRIGPTELRVVSDLGADATHLAALEETTLRRYQDAGCWPHRRVTLAVLQDFDPLAQQLPGPEPAGALAFADRPMVTLYDLADLAACQVMVNRAALLCESTWGDSRALTGLLAHEHAHPLSECATTNAARHMRIDDAGGQYEAGTLPSALGELHRLAARLVLLGPREVLANEHAIRAGFARELFHLNRRTVARVVQSLAGRELLRGQIDGEAANRRAAEAVLLIGDLRTWLELAMESAAFERAGDHESARTLNLALEPALKQLAPQVAPAYAALRENFVALRPTLDAPALAQWAADIVRVLSDALADVGISWHYTITPT